MDTVAIVGVGLIGGSFSLALRQAGFAGALLGVSSPPAIEAALATGAIDRAVSLEEAAALADLIYLAQPVDRILTTLERLGPLARPDCLITDAGSTKRTIVHKASELIRSATFIGGHPMAGKEQRGVEVAESTLFRNRPYVLTPLEGVSSHWLSNLQSWLERIGSKVLIMSPAEHDRTVAWSSHLPQLLSTALAGTLCLQKDPAISQVFGQGLLDMTRLALSSSDLWESILSTNKTEIDLALEIFQQYLGRLRVAVENDDLVDYFANASSFAASIRKVPRTT